jgi:hypothetical protein
MVVVDREVRPPAGAVEGMLAGNGGDNGVGTNDDFDAGCVLASALDLASKMVLDSLRALHGSFFDGERNERLPDKGEGDGDVDARRSTALPVFDFWLLF